MKFFKKILNLSLFLLLIPGLAWAGPLFLPSIEKGTQAGIISGVLKQAAKQGAKKGAKQAAKKSAKEGVKRGAKEAGKKSAKEAGKKGAKQGAKEGAKEVKPIKGTQPSDDKGWKKGDPINNRTKKGEVPSDATVTKRVWKNEGKNAKPGDYSKENLERMSKGKPPQYINKDGEKKSKELHHDPPRREGGKFDVQKLTAEEHAAVDPHRRLKK